MTSKYQVVGNILGSSSINMRLPGGTSGKEPTYQCWRHRDVGSIPESRGSPGKGHDNPFQFCCLENPVDRGAWRAIVHEVTKNPT